eukprot:GDKI01019375.1.p1 GENE.GDKI01019375.1~~GDKI01019375.1.p1  ORF type:complete len:634 (+),score=254.26 GDKI01019375.1:49-1950(+)
MPTVNVLKDVLFKHLGKSYTDAEFDELCFEFGIELDEITSAAEMAKRERGEEAAAGLATDVIYKIDVPANRYDLLCVEGLARALRIFLGIEQPPVFTLTPPEGSDALSMHVEASTAAIRPYVVCAILRGVTFDKQRYESFIELQDKLHQNICRKRTLVAIGTHDLDTIKGPFKYRALDPKDIKFVPLNQTQEVDGHGMMKLYETHQQLKAFLPIIRDSPVYPVIHDAEDRVLSLPPIINGDHSKITLETKNVLIECTATDLTKAEIVLNTVVAMFAGYCSTPFHVEPVKVVYAKDHPKKGGQTIQYPEVASRQMEADLKNIRTTVGVPTLTGDDIIRLMAKMSVGCHKKGGEGEVVVAEIPITRSDILHECDIAEDVAIAYGYNNIKAEVPPTLSWPAEQPINHLCDLLRGEFAQAGFSECLTWGLCSNKENFENMKREPHASASNETQKNHRLGFQYDELLPAVRISNPKTKEFEVVRTSLLPGLLKTLSANKSQALPIQLFEVSDVVVLDPSTETGARNVRRAAALYANLSSGFEVIHGMLDLALMKLGLAAEYTEDQQVVKRALKTYKLVPSKDPSFFPGRQAHIVCEGITLGVVGVVHPSVLEPFEITTPVSMLEFNVEPFLHWLSKAN